MSRLKNSGFFGSGMGKRLLSMALALILMLSLVPATVLTQALAAQTVKVLFRNSDSWSNVYGYAWLGSNEVAGAWPGKQLSKDSATGLYSLSVDVTPSTGTVLSFIFNNNAGSQTDDLSLNYAQLTSGKTYWVDGTAGSVTELRPTENNGKVTFTYEGNASTVLLAGTMNNWSGVSMTKSGSTFTYTYDLSAGTYEYKFVVDGNWVSDPCNPLTTGADNNSYVVVKGSSGGGSSSGTTVPGGTGNKLRLHFRNTLGWESVCGSAWVQSSSSSAALSGWEWPGQLLQKDADGNYLMEVQPGLSSGQSLGYLFHDFNENQTVDLSVSYATLAAGDVDLWVTPGEANEEEKYTCTTATSFTASPKVEGNTVTFTYTGSATSVTVAGSFNSWNGATMTKSGSTFTYTTTIANGLHEYKFRVNGSTWITDPANPNVGGTDGNSILLVGDTVANTADDKITVQFHVTKTGIYTGWDAWVWSDTMDGTAYTLNTGTLSSKLVTVTVDSSASYVAFILRKSDWSIQDETYYVDLKNISSGTVNCFVDYAKDTMMQFAAEDVKNCGVLSYAEMDYEANTFWVKTTAPMDVSGVTITDAQGSTSDITVTSVAAKGFGYTLGLSRLVKLEELSNLRIKLGGVESKIEPDGYIFYSDRFHADYTYNGDDLGATWTKTGTTFKVWAPTAWDMKVIRYTAGNGDYDSNGNDKTWVEEVDMVRGEKGVWTVTIPGDLHGTYYNYRACFANYNTEAVDPYAKSTGIDGYRSMVLNMAATNPQGWDNDISPNQGMTYTDAIIYEMNIREMTIDSTSGVKEEWRGKYLGLTQTGTTYQGHATGLDHLKKLGITHVQIMPFNDFENSPSETDAEAAGIGTYAWGYNPKNFNAPEGSYSTNPFDGSVRVNELKQMIQSLHQSGINVVMDAVYNHVADGGGFCYNKLVPCYFSRFWDVNNAWEEGEYCNSSGCGNDFATQRAMARNYIVDSMLYWVEEYHVDGFRFDLAGLIDTQTMNEAINVIHAKYPHVIFYGEGWEKDGTNMEGYTPTDKSYAAEVPGFAFFNDIMRDAAVGGEHEESGEWGFGMGNSGRAETVMNSMRAINWGWNQNWSGPMTNPNQVINYVACHDKYTLTDKIWYKTHDEIPGFGVDLDWYMAASNRLTNATIFLSQGIPLMYSGDEMLRQKTKSNGWPAHNSGHEKHDDGTDFTNAELDELNKVDWSILANKAYAQLTDDYYEGIIEFRKNHAALRCTYVDENGTADSSKYTSAYRISDQCIMIYVDGFPNHECSDGIVIILNSSLNSQQVNFYDYGVPYGEWQACIHGDQAGIEALWSTTGGVVGVDAMSATVLVKGDLVDENSVYNRQTTTGCRHSSHDQNGNCVSCGTAVGHTFVEGTCVCGKTQPTGNQTIYVDVTGANWTNVNVYSWNADGACTGEWPGNAMTKVTGNVYSYEVPVYAEKIIFNNGTAQTDDLTIPTDGKNLYNYATDSWSTYSTQCAHSYTAKVTTAATCTAAGVKTYTCSKCGDSYTETIATTGHSFANGTCTACGAADPNYVVPNTDYYLIGFINGANYGCDEDWENLGQYKFVNGKLVATFQMDSYVFVKTGDNAKWLLTESYCTDTTGTFVVGGTEKMLVPGGVELTFTLTENADGSVTIHYEAAASECAHSYTSKVTTAATCEKDGVKTYTCTKCGASYTESIAATGHSYTGSVTTAATCTENGVMTYTCSNCTAIYREPIPATGHSFVNGTCSVCGDKQLGDTYYLFGYINGANYACEEDYENMGQYQFVDGKLTATFAETSYVGVKTQDNGIWYMTQGWQGEVNSATLYNADKLFDANKLYVPGGVEVTFTLVENADGTLTLSYTETSTEPSTAPTVTMKFPSVSFEDVIIMNVYYTAENIQDVAEMGLITYSTKPTEGSVDTAEHVVPGYAWSEGDQMYYSSTAGIAPKDIGDTMYFGVYWKLKDGTYGYTKILGYSPKTYALNQLSGGKAEMKPLVVAMLNYGAAAQTYFNYNTGSLMNSTLTTSQQAMVAAYSASMIATVDKASGDKLGTFINDGTYSSRYATVTFEGAFCINYYFTPSLAVKDGVTMYYWDLEAYEANAVLTKENATKAIKMTLTESGEYTAMVDGIAAKDLDKGVYVSFVYNDGTTEHCGGVLSYTIGTYCKTQASKTGTLAELAKACAVYGYYAKQLFN